MADTMKMTLKYRKPNAFFCMIILQLPPRLNNIRLATLAPFIFSVYTRLIPIFEGKM